MRQFEGMALIEGGGLCLHFQFFVIDGDKQGIGREFQLLLACALLAPVVSIGNLNKQKGELFSDFM